MPTSYKFPFYIRATMILVGGFVFVWMLYILQDLLLPLIFAGLFAILMSPMVNYLLNKKVNRALAVGLVLLIFLLILIVPFIYLVSQADLLSEALPELTAKCELLISKTVKWISGFLHLSTRKVTTWFNNAKSEAITYSTIGSTLSTMGAILATVVLVPVYIFMFLYYQPHLVNFIYKVFNGNGSQVSEILNQSKTIIQGYLRGLFAEFSIIAALNTAGLLILGIDYALLLGLAGAVLNVIPYVGGAIAMLLFIAIALLTKPAIYALYVVLLYGFIQLLDNNFIMPAIVGSKVKLNALVSIVAVIAGAALWGVPGMFLSIPLTAILKVIFDHIPMMKPWGFLFGNIVPTTKRNLNFMKKKINQT